MHLELLEWFIENMDPEEFRDKRVLDVGSRYVNGSVRPIVEKFCKPREYIGVDIEDGGCVDVLLPVEDVCAYFGEESFDVVISTELLEHVKKLEVSHKQCKKGAEAKWTRLCHHCFSWFSISCLVRRNI